MLTQLLLSTKRWLDSNRYPPAWNGDAFDTKGEAEYRNKEIARLVGQITVQDAPEWFAIVRSMRSDKKRWRSNVWEIPGSSVAREKPEGFDKAS